MKFLASRFYKIIGSQPRLNGKNSFRNTTFMLRQFYQTSQFYKLLINNLCSMMFYSNCKKNTSKSLVSTYELSIFHRNKLLEIQKLLHRIQAFLLPNFFKTHQHQLSFIDTCNPNPKVQNRNVILENEARNPVP